MKNTWSKIIFFIAFLVLVISSSVSAKTISLSWDPSPTTDIAGYKIHYTSGLSSLPFDGSGAVEGTSPVDIGNTLTSSLTGLPDAQIHYLAVTAYDASGNESIYSNIVTSDAVVANTNQAPVLAAIGSKSISEGSSLTFTISASDADGDSLTYSVSALPSGASFNPLTRTFIWTPNISQSGNYSVTFTVSDGTLMDSETITISVGNVNQAPVLTPISVRGVNEGDTQYIPVSASDPDGDTLTYSASNLPSGASFNATTRIFSWTPSYDQSGSYSVTFSVSDGTLNDSTSVTINVQNVNQSPVLSSISSKSVTEGNSLSFTVSASDADGDSLTYSVSALPSGASFDGTTRSFSWTPESSQSGSYSVTFSVSDGTLNDSEMVAINVINANQAPVLAAIGSKSISEASSLTFIVSASDADGDSLTYSVSALPSGASFNPSTRTFSWTPDNTQAGNYSVIFSVSDGTLSDTESVTISVGNANQAPVLAAIGSKNISEASSLTFIVSASDADGDSLTYSVSALPSGATFNALTRTFSWIPNSTQAGNYVVTFSVSDGNLSDSEMVAINVDDVNQAPVLAAIGSKSTSEASMTFIVSASDADGDSLTYSVSALPSGASFNPLTRTFSWTPNSTQAGNYVVTFSVSDGNLSDSEIVAINVDDVNQAPLLAAIGSKNISEASSLTFIVSASDADGDSLTYSVSALPSGASFNTSTRTFSWTPDNTQAGNYSVTFSVSDGSLSDAENVTISVEANVPQDSDGDGVLDNQDAFPQDPSEWIDTDRDGIGNNADADDDNDGVSDEADSSPLDSSISAWIISAAAGEGGAIAPAGDSLLAYGGAQVYSISAATGFSISDVLVDGISVGPVEQYIFVAVDQHHSIEALFQPGTDGLSLVSSEIGLPGVDRVDAGDDSNNYVDGMPKGDLDYIFRVVLQDTTGEELPSVMLILNGYAYRMNHQTGNVASGATYAFTTRLGPAASQTFHFETRDANGRVLSRFPVNSDLDGPQVELMDGKNVVGVPGNIASEQLYSTEALGSFLSYRWIPSDKRNGSYQLVDSGGPVIAGEGYVIKKTDEIVLPSMEQFGENLSDVYEIQVKTGWNLIANPYGGNVSLAAIQLQIGTSVSLSWADAVASLQVVDGVYYYAGKDWGNNNIFETSGGEQGAILIPRIGYWIYVNSVSESVFLTVPKPQQ